MERAAKAEQGKSKVTGPSEPEGWVGGRPTPPNFGRSRWNAFSIKDLGLLLTPRPKISDLPTALQSKRLTALFAQLLHDRMHLCL